MYKTTTPKFNLIIPYKVPEVDAFVITLQQQGKTIIEFTEKSSRVTFEDRLICFKLTQQETSIFVTRYPIHLQMRLLLSNGDVVACEVVHIDVHSVLNSDILSKEVTLYTITNNLTNATTNNALTSIPRGEEYRAEITADSGYTLDGAAVLIIMGTDDITSSAYNDGTILIPSVLDNLSITLSAVEIVVISISALYTQTREVYIDDTLDSLKQDLVVTALYSDGTTKPILDYTLSGTLVEGSSVITVSYLNCTTTFVVDVSSKIKTFNITNNLIGVINSNPAISIDENTPYEAIIAAREGYTLNNASVLITMSGVDITSSAYMNGNIYIPAVTGDVNIVIEAVEISLTAISATYTPSGTVHFGDDINSLRKDLVILAIYSDGTTEVIDDYILSGTLTVGVSTILVLYENKSTSFNVLVTYPIAIAGISAVGRCVVGKEESPQIAIVDEGLVDISIVA